MPGVIRELFAGIEIVRLIVWLIVGLIAGWLAATLTKESSYGIVGNTVVGLIGAMIGGWLFSTLDIGFRGDGGLLTTLVTATIGAVIFLVLLRAVTKTTG